MSKSLTNYYDKLKPSFNFHHGFLVSTQCNNQNNMASNSQNSVPTLNSFLVGGAVRDKLLNRAVKDRDYLVVGTSVEQMLSLGFTQVGKDFPVFLHPITKEEYALARTERKQGTGYTGFVCYAEPDVTIEEDLLRRDLTVNAMAMNNDGTIIDPYNGQQDLKDRVLRHVSNAFVEDPLRVLRVARFAARYHDYGFSVADETLTLMSRISLSGELSSLSAERIWQEMQLSLAEDHPEIFFEVLLRCQALKTIWPELEALWGIPNPAQWHPEICSGVHTMMVLKQAVMLTNKSNEPPATRTVIRFAALCHDLGKGLTQSTKWPSHHGHEKAGLPLVEKIASELKIPNQYKQLALKVCEHHLHCHKAFQLKASTLLNLFNQIDVWRKPEEFEPFIIACKADFLGRLGFENRHYPQEQYLKDALAAASKVNAKGFVEQGLKGLDIKEAIAEARLKAIQAVKNQYEGQS